VKRLKSHPDFTISNPNRARSLISTFCGNLAHFHSPDGLGYRFLSDSILEIDRVNPQVAARMVASFAQWKKFDEIRSDLMRLELEKILSVESLSSDTFEVVNRCLKK
jgi:aminopeptidase N